MWKIASHSSLIENGHFFLSVSKPDNVAGGYWHSWKNVTVMKHLVVHREVGVFLPHFSVLLTNF